MKQQPSDNLPQIASDMRQHGDVCFQNGLDEYANRIDAVSEFITHTTRQIMDHNLTMKVRMERLGQLHAIIKEGLVAANQLVHVALPKFNWSASPLDADAIRILNEAPQKIRAALEVM
jgi:hypothetical protein